VALTAEDYAQEPGVAMSLAFATECEALTLAFKVRMGQVSKDDLIEACEETADLEPRIALGWVHRWELVDAAKEGD
jgi:hypothetical protein